MAFVTAAARASAAPTGPAGPDGHLANRYNVIRQRKGCMMNGRLIMDMPKTIFIFIISFILICSNVYASGYGKICGRVIDHDLNIPISAANKANILVTDDDKLRKNIQRSNTNLIAMKYCDFVSKLEDLKGNDSGGV